MVYLLRFTRRPGFMAKGRAKPAILTEPLIAAAIFIVCAAVCAWVLIEARAITRDADVLNSALVVVKDGAEAFKAHSDPLKAAESLGGHNLVVYYCADWMISSETDAKFALKFISMGSFEGRPVSVLAVRHITGEEIAALTVTAGGGLRE
jgi:hypothetical protein